jgi:hypothetical protein
MRLRPLWVWRLLALGFAAVYLASPSVQLWLPPVLPFLAAAAVEAHFFIAGLRAPHRDPEAAADPGPQPRDLAELGWAEPGEPDDAGDPEPSPQRRLPRRRVRVLPALAVLAVFAGLILLDRRGQHWQHLSAASRAQTVAMLERQAGRIAGHRASIVCDVSGRRVGYVQDADGLAEVGGHRVWLTPSICYRLYLVTHDRRARGTSTGRAIAVLAHEAWHLRGESSEARANCFAYQSGVEVGRALGLPVTNARRLMRGQLADNPGEFADAPAYVVPAGCRRGGSLDLHLDGPHFP